MATKKNGGNWLNMNEPELFEQIRKEFARRKLSEISLSSKVRLALAEWLESLNKNK